MYRKVYMDLHVRMINCYGKRDEWDEYRYKKYPTDPIRKQEGVNR